MQSKPVEIADGIYWVGDANVRESGLVCNPYLIIAGEEAALVDPGSPLDFAVVYENVVQLVPLKHIKYVILQHQDPDFCASLPLFEQAGLTALLVAHWRAAQIIKYYGVTSEFYILNPQRQQLKFANGRVLQFIDTPYLHFSGAINTYDRQTKTLLSSDLFGAYTQHCQGLFADETVCGESADMYMEAIKTFHEHYMPANEIIRPVMDKLLQLDIKIIAPQHGSILRQHIPEYIKELRELECGTLLAPVKKEIAKSAGIEHLCNQVLYRLAAIFPPDEVTAVFADSKILIDPQEFAVLDYDSTSRELWQNMFRIIAAQKGWMWLAVIEPLVGKLVQEYDLEKPDVFTASLLAMEKQTYELTEVNRMLQAINERLEQSIQNANDALLKCPVTGLYNQNVLQKYLQEEAAPAAAAEQTSALLLLSIDNMAALNSKHGSQGGDEILKAVAYLLNELVAENHKIFKIGGAAFAYYIAGTNRQAAAGTAENIRVTIEKSALPVEPITASIGAGLLGEFIDSYQTAEETADLFFTGVQNRMQMARNRGQNQVCFDFADGAQLAAKGKVLIADYDQSNIELLTTAFMQEQYEVLTAADGESAWNLIDMQMPDAIIAELMLPKLDAFQVKEKIRALSASKDIPFILLSHQKDLASVQRAMALGIEHYLTKPYYLSEVVGIVNNKIMRARSKQGS